MGRLTPAGPRENSSDCRTVTGFLAFVLKEQEGPYRQSPGFSHLGPTELRVTANAKGRKVLKNSPPEFLSDPSFPCSVFAQIPLTSHKHAPWQRSRNHSPLSSHSIAVSLPTPLFFLMEEVIINERNLSVSIP